MAESAVQSLRDSIDEKIAGSSAAILEQVIATFVDEEKNKRAKIIVAGVVALRDLDSDLNKINRADIQYYDGTGAPTGPVFSKERVNAIKKAKDKILKLEFALTKAVSEQAVIDDFTKLDKLTKSKGDAPKGESEGDE